ncbi:hypothetical protein D3C71_766870 [compost metagenome]
MKHIKKLSLVPVQTFDLNVKDRVRIDADSILLLDIRSQLQLVLLLNVINMVLEPFVLTKLKEIDQLARLRNPSAANRFGDQSSKSRIGMHQPAAMRNSVRLVVEALRIQFIE